MTDRNIRTYPRRTINDLPFGTWLYGEFTLGTDDGEDLLFNLMAGTRIMDSFVRVKTPAVGSLQVITLALDDTGDDLTAPINSTLAGTTRQSLPGDLAASKAEANVVINRSVSASITAGAVVQVGVFCYREDFSL